MIRPLHAASFSVTRATLANGLQVVVVHDSLAPVVTTIMDYKVGSDEQTLPGLAHATEHMMFRGSNSLSSGAFMDVVSLTGGDFDADTQDAITEYYFTVPVQYLDIAMRLERSRATGLEMAQSQWNQERLAITQEVTQDNSDAFYRLFTKMTDRILTGTPYAKNGLGTVYGFAHEINSPQLLRFYHAWYHPNNAVYIIVGDVDGPSTVARVRRLFGDLPPAAIPAKPAVHLQPVQPATYRDTSDLPVTIVLLGYRMPGYSSPNYAAGQILGDVLSSQRSSLYALVAGGKLLDTGFEGQSFSDTSIGLQYGVVSAQSNPAEAAAMMRAAIARYRTDGVPADLVAAEKRREIAQLEYARNSVEDLAMEWSQAIAVQGLRSPDDEIAAFDRVTVADVNRVLRRDLVDARSITAYAVPKNSGRAVAGRSGIVPENNQITPSTHEPLPPWARGIVAHLRVPPQTLAPTVSVLPNGLHLIVQPESSSASVTLSGRIRNDPQVQEPIGEEGVNDVTEGLFSYGTATYGRIAYQTALDAVAANVSAGTTFSLQVLAKDFNRGVQLLADDELHPALNAADFAVVKMQAIETVAGEAASPDHLTDVALAHGLYPSGDPAQRFPTPESIRALTLDDVRAWYASAYRPDLTTIVVVGDVTPQEARNAVERYFGGWHATEPKPVTAPPPVPNNVASSVTIPANGRVQSSVVLEETMGLRRASRDWAALQVANTALTGGFYGSLLGRDLRELHGYAYAVNSRVEANQTRAMFVVEYACNAGNVAPAEALVQRDLSQLQRAPLPEDRLTRAKALLLGSVPVREASYDGVASQLLDYAANGLPWNENLIDARRELASSAADVQRAMRKWIRPSGFVRVVTGPGPT